MDADDRRPRTFRRARLALAFVAIATLPGCAWMNLPSGQQLDVRAAEQRLWYELYLHHIADASQAGSTDALGMREFATAPVANADLAWIADLTQQGITIAEPPDVDEVIEFGDSRVIVMCIRPETAVWVDADGVEVDAVGVLPLATAIERSGGEETPLTVHREATDGEAGQC